MASRLVEEAASDPALDAVSDAVGEVLRTFSVVGTRAGDWPGASFVAPWFLIDSRAADHEVGHPGGLVAEFSEVREAYRALNRLVGLAVVRAASGGPAPYLPD